MSKFRVNGVKSHRKHWIIVFGILFIFGLIGSIGAIYAQHLFIFKPHKVEAVATKSVEIKPKPVVNTQITGRYLFNGSIAWDRAIERDAKGNYDRPFSNLDSFNPAKYDAWIADLECPVTNAVIPYQTQVDKLVFNCPPAFDASARKYFSILNLANNHAYDQGRDGFLETQKHLTADGFQVYGSYDPADTPNICEVISLPIRLQKSDSREVKARLPVAFCAFHALAKFPNADELAVVSAYAKVMPVFAFGHLGIEYTPTASAQQQRLAHDMIDAGAEFVIMNHPHWVQNTEVYNHKLIVYSTGNFIYDQLTYEDQRGASIDVLMSAPYSDNLAKWIAYGASCGATNLNDSCLANVPAGLTKPHLSFMFDLVASDERPPQRWLTRLADSTLQFDTEKRANWTQTLEQLGQNQRLN